MVLTCVLPGTPAKGGFNPQTLSQIETVPGNLNSAMPGASKNVLLHWGDVYVHAEDYGRKFNDTNVQCYIFHLNVLHALMTQSQLVSAVQLKASFTDPSPEVLTERLLPIAQAGSGLKKAVHIFIS
ncbi:TPA: hypothetical protein ACH3X2_011359 [Trebouxia sp. C0005]